MADGMKRFAGPIVMTLGVATLGLCFAINPDGLLPWVSGPVLVMSGGLILTMQTSGDDEPM